MFELGFTQLGIVGGAILAVGLYIMAEQDKYSGLWVSFIGFVVISAGVVVHLHKVFAESDRHRTEHAERPGPLLAISLGAVYLDSPEPGKMTAWVRIKNIGKEPAYKVRSWQGFMRSASGQNPFDSPRNPENEIVLGEGQEFNLYSTLSVDAEQIDASPIAS